MSDLMRYAAQLEPAENNAGAPVHLWNPAYCGDINLVIKRDGTWFYEGTPIGRARLVRLFSTVLKREGEKYFLVTPVEKLGIEVEDAPFVAVLMSRNNSGREQELSFTTNVGELVIADAEHEIVFRFDPETDEPTPYIHIRSGLEARISRAVYYDLVAIGEEYEGAFGVWSCNQFFAFAEAKRIFEQ